MRSHHRPLGSAHLNNSLKSLKSISSGVNQEINIIALGELEKTVIDEIINSTLKRFSPRDLWKKLNLDPRRIHDVLTQLINKGFLRKVSRGLYEIVPEKIQEYLRSTIKVIQKRRSKKVNQEMNQGSPPTSPRDRGLNMFVGGVGRYNVYGDGSVFLFLDNLRGVGVGGVYRFGDRGSVVDPWFVSEVFERVDYAEFGLFVGDSSIYLPGIVEVYPAYIIGQGYGIKFEFRPYSWFNNSVLRGNDRGGVNISLGFKYLWRILLSIWLVLSRVLLSDAPLEVRKIVSSWIRRRYRCS
ncbi:MAG: hypothetical protein C0179_04835 [Fervidicoccus sp.]|nr:MAG: hypothetical protein C0179_04835 [Fervidicoccus sp.]